MFVFGIIILVGLLYCFLAKLGEKTLDVGILLTAIYVMLTLVGGD